MEKETIYRITNNYFKNREDDIEKNIKNLMDNIKNILVNKFNVPYNSRINIDINENNEKTIEIKLNPNPNRNEIIFFSTLCKEYLSKEIRKYIQENIKEYLSKKKLDNITAKDIRFGIYDDIREKKSNIIKEECIILEYNQVKKDEFKYSFSFNNDNTLITFANDIGIDPKGLEELKKYIDKINKAIKENVSRIINETLREFLSDNKFVNIIDELIMSIIILEQINIFLDTNWLEIKYNSENKIIKKEFVGQETKNKKSKEKEYKHKKIVNIIVKEKNVDKFNKKFDMIYNNEVLNCNFGSDQKIHIIINSYISEFKNLILTYNKKLKFSINEKIKKMKNKLKNN